jgi:ABC-type transport system substrate-binding protein
MYALVGDVDPDSSYNRYYSAKIPTDANKGNGSNDGRINDPILDKALDDQRATADQAKRKEAWVTFQKELYSQVWDIPLYTRVNNYVVSNKIHNFKANPASDGNFWNIVEVYIQ